MAQVECTMWGSTAVCSPMGVAMGGGGGSRAQNRIDTVDWPERDKL